MKRVVTRDQQVVGTYDDATLVALLNAGTLKLTDQHWDAATSTWRPLTDFVGRATRRRDYAGPAGRIAVLMLTAACGATAAWWVMRDLDAAAATISATLGMSPVKVARQELATQVESDHRLNAAPATQKMAAPEATAAPKKHPSEVLTLLNVEVFDDEVAITVQNNGTEPVNGFDLKVSYFALPGDQTVFDSNVKTIANLEATSRERTARIKKLDEEITALGLHLKLVGTDVITWTPSHIKALPDAAMWATFDSKPLAEAGASAKSTAIAFAEGVSSINSETRNRALTGYLLDLARKLDDLRPLIQGVINQKAKERTELKAGQRQAEALLAELGGTQEQLQPTLASKLEVARHNAVRTEIVHVDRAIEGSLVQRITLRRQHDESLGVWVELARAADKAVAVNQICQPATD